MLRICATIDQLCVCFVRNFGGRRKFSYTVFLPPSDGVRVGGRGLALL